MPEVDPELHSQQPEPMKPFTVQLEFVLLHGIFTALPGAQPSVAAAESSEKLTDSEKLHLVHFKIAHGEEYLGPQKEY